MRQWSGHFSHLSSPVGTAASFLSCTRAPSEVPASAVFVAAFVVPAVPHDASLTEPSALIAAGGANDSIVFPPQLASTKPIGTVPSKCRYSRRPKV